MVPCWLKSPWPHLNIRHTAGLFSLESPLDVWPVCDWLARVRLFKTILTQTSSWTVSKKLLKNFFTHLFYNIGPCISQPPVSGEWESVWQSKLIKAHTVIFVHNSLWLHNPLPGALKEWGQFGAVEYVSSPVRRGVQDSQHRPFLGSSANCHRQPLTKCVPFPSTSGTLDGTAHHSFLPLCLLMW